MIGELLEFRRLQRNWKLSPSDLATLQERKLRTVIRHAYENVPYYHSLFRSVGLSPEDIRSVEDLKYVPITTKKDLKAAGVKKIMTRGINPSSCIMLHTAGSTGKPFTIYLTHGELMIRRLIEFRALLSIGMCPRDRLSVLGPEHLHQTRFHQRLGFYRSQNISHFLPIEDQVRNLKEIHPTLLWAYPTVLRAVLHYLDYPLSKIIRPRILITSAEVFDEITKERIQADLNPEMFNFYGAIEIGRIASECPSHEGLHVNADHLILECLNDDQPAGFEKPGEVVITTLNAFAMPFIRYRLGDICTIIEKRCSCGSSFPLIGPVQGRELDMVQLPSGKLLSPIGLHTILEKLAEINQYRFIQKSPDHLVLKLLFHENPEEKLLLDIRSKLKEYLVEPVMIDIQIVDFIHEDALKFRSFISELGQTDSNEDIP